MKVLECFSDSMQKLTSKQTQLAIRDARLTDLAVLVLRELGSGPNLPRLSHHPNSQESIRTNLHLSHSRKFVGSFGQICNTSCEFE